MGVINQPEDLLSRLRDLERQVRELRRGSLTNAVLSSGNLEVRTPDGFLIARIGEFDAWGTPATGMQIFRRDGSLQARFFDTAGSGGGGYWSLFDEASNIIASEDTVSGFGLALPYLQVTAMPYSSVLSPPQSTTSATFTPLHRVHGQRQQPYLRTYLICQTDASTTGEVQLAVGGVAISTTPLSLPASDNTYRILDAPMSGSHLSFFNVDVEVRRTSGAGTVRVGVAFASGRQS